MAYIITPLIFMIIGYAIAAIIFSPFFEVIYAAGSLVTSRDGPDFTIGLYAGFDEEIADDGETEGEMHISEITTPRHGVHFAEIRNRRIGLQAPVYFGDDYEILRYGVGQFIGSVWPGFGGTILLAGHNTHHFLPLKDIEIGDVVDLRTNYAQFEYEVVHIEIFHRDVADEAFDLGQTEIELLVMYTCYPFNVNNIGNAQYRMFVYAEKISGPEIDIMARE